MDPQAAAALQAATPVSPGPSWPKPPLWSSASLKRNPASSSAGAAAASPAIPAAQSQGAQASDVLGDTDISQQAAAQAAAAEASANTAALHAATASQQTPLEMAAKVVEAVPGIKPGHAGSHEQQDSSQARSWHAQQQRQEAAKVWGGVEYDSNFADIDGTLHVFSDAGMTDDEADEPMAPLQKYVLLDRVPQVCLHTVPEIGLIS